MANFLTSIRIVASVALLFCSVFSPTFYVLYLTAGFTDMIDGTVARKTGTATELGAKLDTFADGLFLVACLIKLLPVLNLPSWLILWIVAIFAIKFINLVLGYIKHKKLVAVHSILNKVTGGALFVFPLALPFVDVVFTSSVICAIATMAAIEEGFIASSDSPEVLSLRSTRIR